MESVSRSARPVPATAPFGWPMPRAAAPRGLRICTVCRSARRVGRRMEERWISGREGIYFVEAEDADQPADIRYFDIAKKTTRLIGRTSAKPALGGTCLTVSPDERWITWAQVDRAGSDIILVDGFR